MTAGRAFDRFASRALDRFGRYSLKSAAHWGTCNSLHFSLLSNNLSSKGHGTNVKSEPCKQPRWGIIQAESKSTGLGTWNISVDFRFTTNFSLLSDNLSSKGHGTNVKSWGRIAGGYLVVGGKRFRWVWFYWGLKIGRLENVWFYVAGVLLPEELRQQKVEKSIFSVRRADSSYPTSSASRLYWEAVK